MVGLQVYGGQLEHAFSCFRDSLYNDDKAIKHDVD